MHLGINGKIALVTAASRGLGLGCAKQLAAEQCRVAICSRDGIAAKKVAKGIADQTEAEVVGFGADVGCAEDISRLLGEVKNSLGNPEILVTNAGGM
jgi:3-oxoacyl-[acyl-carrier protein] reductase